MAIAGDQKLYLQKRIALTRQKSFTQLLALKAGYGLSTPNMRRRS